MIRSDKLQLLAGFADQAVMSAASFALLIVAAQNYGPEYLGAFATGVVTVQILVGILRAFVGEVLLLIDWTGHSAREDQDAASLAFTIAVSAALAALGVVLMLIDDLTASAIGAALLGTIGMALQDQRRFTLMRQNRQLRMAIVNLAIVVAQLAAVGTLTAASVEPRFTILAWALVPGVVGLTRWQWTGVAAFVTGVRHWFSYSRVYGSAFGTEAALGAVATWLSLLAIAAFASLGEVAAYRALTTLFGATTLLLSFLRYNILAHMARSGRLTMERAVRYGAAMSIFILGSVAAVLTLMLLVPDTWGNALLGDTWALAEPFVALIAVRQVAVGLITVPAIILRVLHVTWEATRWRLWIELANLGIAPLSVYLAGVNGFLWAGTVSAATLALVLARLAYHKLKGGSANALGTA